MLGATLSIGVTPVTTSGISHILPDNAPGGLTLVASDYTLVLSGPVGSDTYDVSLQLDTPFLYNPADGNLILQFFTPASYGMAVRSFFGSSVSGSATSRANYGDNADPEFARMIQYNFVDAAVGVPELNTVHSLPAFTFVGMLCLAGRRRYQA